MDYGSRYADRRQRIIEKRLQKVYREAQKDLDEKFEDFLTEHKKKGAEMWRKLQNQEITQEQYASWMRGQVFTGKRWQQKIDAATDTLKLANEKALTIIRSEQMGVFAENANHEAYKIEKDFNGAVSFDIYDVSSVDRLVREKPELLPRKEVNGRKDKAWNQGLIANSVTQAIIQGESIQRLAARLSRDTANSDMKSMTRYARTAMTGAQNSGRIETMHRAQDMGIDVKKQWLATLDSRTRDSHRHLDGQVQEVDDPFKSDFGKIMYPGDPAAHPGDVYNCRCTLVYVYPDFPSENALRRDQETGETVQDMTYNEWKNWKNKKGSFPQETLDNKKNNGNMITGAVTGAKKTPGWEDRHAERYYEEVRNRKAYADADKISQKSPFTREEAEKVRLHVFVKEHDLDDGKRRFDVDYDQAEAWQRLVEGRGTKEDEELIRHELAEIKYIEEGYPQSKAHELANREHNWWALVMKRKGGK